MNPWQMAQQIKAILIAAVWPEGAGDPVFGLDGVKVTSGEPSNEQVPGVFPAVLVVLGAAAPDPDDPDVLKQTVSVLTMASVAGDPMGEFAIIGGSVDNLGKSVGRGLIEIAARVRAELEDLTGADGAGILTTGVDIEAPQHLDGAHFVTDDHSFEIVCTSALEYAQPEELAEGGSAGSGGWTWAGGDLNGAGHCSGRFDFVQYRLGYVSGEDPAVNPGDATIVATVTTAAATHTKVAGRAYSVWADYSSRGQTGVIEGSSRGNEVGAYLTT